MTAPITKEERADLAGRKIAARFLNTEFGDEGTFRLAAAYEARVQELERALAYVMKTRHIQCQHKHPPPDEWCAACVARRALGETP